MNFPNKNVQIQIHTNPHKYVFMYYVKESCTEKTKLLKVRWHVNNKIVVTKGKWKWKEKNNKINNISIKCNEFYHKFCLLALLFSCHLPVKQIYNSSICCVTIPKIHLLFSILPSCHPQLLTHFIPCKIHSYHITYIHIYNIHTYIRT